MPGCQRCPLVTHNTCCLPQGLKCLEVDTVVLCAGQTPLRELESPLQASMPVWKIGGAHEAAELDAKRAIDQGTRLAAQIERAAPGAVFDAPIDTSAKVLQFVRASTQLLG